MGKKHTITVLEVIASKSGLDRGRTSRLINEAGWGSSFKIVGEEVRAFLVP